MVFEHMSNGDFYCKRKCFIQAEYSYSLAMSLLQEIVNDDSSTLTGRLHNKRAITRMKLNNFNGALEDAIFNIQLNFYDVSAHLIASVSFMRNKHAYFAYKASSIACTLISKTRLAINNMEDAFHGHDTKKVK